MHSIVRSGSLGLWSLWLWPLRGRLYVCLALGLLTASTARVSAQQIEQGVPIVSESIASRVDGYDYRPDSTSRLDFRGTALAPRAQGSVKVRTRSDLTEIDAKFENMPAAASFGPFAVYVLWVVTPEGRANNVGAINIEDQKGSLNATTPLSSFALIVTAEPHFAVSVPSKFIVLQDIGGDVQGTRLVVTSLAERADYAGLKPIVDDPRRRVPVELDMAHYALTIAEGARAPELAPVAYQRAHGALAAADAAVTARSSSVRERVPALAREAIQAAEDARAAAQARAQAAELEQLHQQLSDRDAKLRQALTLSDQGKLQAAAAQTQLESGLESCRSEVKAVEQRLPSRSSRLQQANELLSRWLVLDADEQSITAHLSSDGFSKGRIELTADEKERLSTAAGILLGIGGVNVTVTPALQLSDDVRQLGLSQQRARAIMEWLASQGIRASAGVPVAASAAVEHALAPGPGVDMQITFPDSTAAPASVRPDAPPVSLGTPASTAGS